MTREELLYVALHQATEEGVGIHLATFADICIEWATNEVIDKACEWLTRELCYIARGINLFNNKTATDEFVESFKKAMKGGEG